MQPRVPVSVGELMDKISILVIKTERITDELKLANVRRELARLSPELDAIVDDSEHRADWQARLHEVNGRLWDIEDSIRRCEAAKDFGHEFVELARAVYKTTDLRAAIKREINEATGSDLVEEKSYEEY